MRREVVDGLSVGHGGDVDGASVLFVHGAMDRGAGFLRTVRSLPDLSWTVYDRRGYGRSADGSAPTFDRHVDDLITLVARRDGDRALTVVGHSLGGTIALAAASRRPDLISSCLVHEAPLPWMSWWPTSDAQGRRIEDDGPIEAVDRFMARVIGPTAWEALPATTREQRRSEGATLISELVSLRSGPPFEGPEISAPVIVSRGSAADPVRVRAASHLVDVVPSGRLAVIDGAPHGAHGSHPAEFARLVRDAVASARWGRPDHDVTCDP